MADALRPARVSVVIPVHRGGEAFRLCLASVEAARPGPCEVIVVADGDLAEDRATAEAAGARVLSLSERSGPARARNLGARAARGDVLLFVDADVTVPPNAVARVAAAFDDPAGPTAVFGSYDDEPAEPNFFSQYKNLTHHFVHQTSREDASTFWGACGAIRRDVFLAVGGFNEAYPAPCVEDVELGYRLTGAGHRVRLCKDLQVKHLKRWTLRSLVVSDTLRRALPWTELVLRHPRLARDLNLGLASRASLVLSFGLIVALAATAVWPASLLAAGVVALALLALNGGLYGFFLRKRGLGFAARAVPAHWLYYVCGGLGFGLGLVQYLLGRRAWTRPGGGTNEEPV
jgi:GT2 family glycosyltransferase